MTASGNRHRQARGFFPAAVTFLKEAWDLFARWGSAGANAVDCVSFAIMRRLSIEKAFTFDELFRLAGFETLG